MHWAQTVVPRSRKVRKLRAEPVRLLRLNCDVLGARELLDATTGGGRGIRTLDTVSRIHAFQACAFSHSATPPGLCGRLKCRRGPGSGKSRRNARAASHLATHHADALWPPAACAPPKPARHPRRHYSRVRSRHNDSQATVPGRPVPSLDDTRSGLLRMRPFRPVPGRTTRIRTRPSGKDQVQGRALAAGCLDPRRSGAAGVV